MKILYICPDQEKVEYLEKVFVANFPKLEFYFAVEFDEALMLFKGGSRFGFVLLDETLRSKTYEVIIKELSQLNRDRPILFIGLPRSLRGRIPQNFFHLHKANGIIELPLVIPQFRKIISTAIKIVEEQELVENTIRIEKTKLLPMKTNNFYYFQQIPYDAYREVGNNQFVKVIYKNEVFSPSLINKFNIQKINYLYLEKDDHLELTEKTIQDLLEKLDIGKNKILPAEIFEYQIKGCSLLHEQLRAISVTNPILDLARKIIEATIFVYQQVKDLKEILQLFPLGQKGLPEKSILTSYFCEAILEGMGWNSDIPKFQLGLSSLLHDYSLQNDDLSKLTLWQERGPLSMLTPEELEQFKDHPKEAALVALNFRGFPPSDFLIAQHHELPTSKGFPFRLSSTQLTTLSCTFILSSNFVGELLQKGTTEKSIQIILPQFAKVFKEGNFKDPLKVLLNIFA